MVAQSRGTRYGTGSSFHAGPYRLKIQSGGQYAASFDFLSFEPDGKGTGGV